MKMADILADGPARFHFKYDDDRTVSITIECKSQYDAMLVMGRIAEELIKAGKVVVEFTAQPGASITRRS